MLMKASSLRDLAKQPEGDTMNTELEDDDNFQEEEEEE